MLRKNTAGQFIHIAAVNATTGAALTGATISMRRCLDGTFAAGGATITEDTGLGFYKVALAQADTNGNDCGYFFTATNMIPICVNVITTAADPTDSVRFGLTALPNATAGASGGVVLIGTGSNNFKSDASANVTFANTSIATVTTVTNQLTGAQIATAVWQDATAGDFTAAGSIGKSIMNGVSLGTGLTVNDITTKSGFSLTAGTGLGNQTANITGNLSGSVGSVTGAVGSVTGNVGGNVTGSVGSVAVGGITAPSFAANSIDATALATTAVDEIREGVWAKTQTELTGDPGATPTVLQAQMLEYMAIRNKRDTDSGLGTDEIHNNAGTVILTAAISDAAGVFSKAKYA